MVINVDLQKEIYSVFNTSGLVLDVLKYAQEDKLLETRGLLAQMIDNYRELNSLERLLHTTIDVNKHNGIVETIQEMEVVYSKVMMLIEEYELLRQ